MDTQKKHEHMFHLGCLVLARNEKNCCPSCQEPLNISENNMNYIRCADNILVAACFANATYGGRLQILEMLSRNFFLAHEGSLICLQIAIQQKNLEMVKYWVGACNADEIARDSRNTYEGLTVEIYNILNRRLENVGWTCVSKCLAAKDSSLAVKILSSYTGLSKWLKLKHYWFQKGRKEKHFYCHVCDASMWGKLDALQVMKEKAYDIHISGDLALISAHFMGEVEVEIFLTSNGCQLKTQTRAFKLAQACATGNVQNFKKHIKYWKQDGNYTLSDILLKLMLVLLIKNSNVAMIEMVLSKCEFVLDGIISAFEYALNLELFPVIHKFMTKHKELASTVVSRGCKLGDDRLVSEGLQFLDQARSRQVMIKVYFYGMIHQNAKMLDIGMAAMGIQYKK